MEIIDFTNYILSLFFPFYLFTVIDIIAEILYCF